MIKNKISILSLLLATILVIPQASARLLFSNETDWTEADTFIINYDDDVSDMKLQFGNHAGSGSITFHSGSTPEDNYFELSNDLDLGTNELKNFKIQNEETAFEESRTFEGGEMYYNTLSGTLNYFDGELDEWVILSASGAASATASSSSGGLGVFVGTTHDPDALGSHPAIGSFSTIATIEGYTKGGFTYGAHSGYTAANYACNQAHPGAHMCQAVEMMTSIYDPVASALFTGQGAWIAEGAPGYTAKAGDCEGWTANYNDLDGTEYFGSWWSLTAGGGKGAMTKCGISKPIACCK